MGFGHGQALWPSAAAYCRGIASYGDAQGVDFHRVPGKPGDGQGRRLGMVRHHGPIGHRFVMQGLLGLGPEDAWAVFVFVHGVCD